MLFLRIGWHRNRRRLPFPLSFGPGLTCFALNTSQRLEVSHPSCSHTLHETSLLLNVSIPDATISPASSPMSQKFVDCMLAVPNARPRSFGVRAAYASAVSCWASSYAILIPSLRSRRAGSTLLLRWVASRSSGTVGRQYPNTPIAPHPVA